MLQNDEYSRSVHDLHKWAERSTRKRPSPDWVSLATSDLPLPPMRDYTAPMNDITREEINAKLETIEVKMDARVESISSKIETFLAAQAERDKRLDESFAGVRRDIDKLGSLKLNIWGAMLTAVGLGVAITALSLTFYQTGKADAPPATQASSTSPAPLPKTHN